MAKGLTSDIDALPHLPRAAETLRLTTEPALSRLVVIRAREQFSDLPDRQEFATHRPSPPSSPAPLPPCSLLRLLRTAPGFVTLRPGCSSSGPQNSIPASLKVNSRSRRLPNVMTSSPRSYAAIVGRLSLALLARSACDHPRTARAPLHVSGNIFSFIPPVANPNAKPSTKMRKSLYLGYPACQLQA